MGSKHSSKEDQIIISLNPDFGKLPKQELAKSLTRGEMSQEEKDKLKAILSE